MTVLRANKYMRIPFIVTGHEVTEENMKAVAAWCEGHVIKTNEKVFIRVPIANVRNIKQTEAYIGDHVTRIVVAGQSTFKVEKGQWLSHRFVVISDMAVRNMGLGIEDSDDLEMDDTVVPLAKVRPLPTQIRPRNSAVAKPHNSRS